MNKGTDSSVLLSYFFANINLFHREKLDIQKSEYFSSLHDKIDIIP